MDTTVFERGKLRCQKIGISKFQSFFVSLKYTSI